MGRGIRKVKIFSKKPYSHILFEADGDWILTFLLGGPIEFDVSVKLTEDEVERAKNNEGFVDQLVAELKKDKSRYENRKIVPAIWPSRFQ